MEYKVIAFRARTGSVIELADDVTPIGVVCPQPVTPIPTPIQSAELYIICLEPTVKKTEEKKEEEEKEEGKEEEEKKEEVTGKGNTGD